MFFCSAAEFPAVWQQPAMILGNCRLVAKEYGGLGGGGVLEESISLMLPSSGNILNFDADIGAFSVAETQTKACCQDLEPGFLHCHVCIAGHFIHLAGQKGIFFKQQV